jgi:N-acetylglutamate synthase-like GNAT family acetyltransferase
LFHLRLRECIRLFKALRNVSNAKLSLNLPANAVELYIVGVNPANQGQGRLSRLLKPVLEVMHEQERPVLVMTNTESNKAIYEHLGFKLVKVLNDKDADCISYYLVK